MIIYLEITVYSRNTNKLLKLVVMQYSCVAILPTIHHECNLNISPMSLIHIAVNSI